MNQLAMNQMMSQYNMQPGGNTGAAGGGSSPNSGWGSVNNSYANGASNGYGSSMPVQGGNAYGDINMASGMAAFGG